MKALDAALLVSCASAVPATAISIRSGTGVGSTIRTAGAIGLSWLIGLPRRLGNRLFVMNDAEAGWRGWEVAELAIGLGRQYRDARFATTPDTADLS